MPRRAARFALAAALHCIGLAGLIDTSQAAFAAPASGATDASAAADASAASAYIARQGWTPFDSMVRPRMPADDLVPLMYFRQGSSAPSCALLGKRPGGMDFFEILATEPGEDYPHCGAVYDGAGFTFAGKRYVVVPYSQRDTREDNYGGFFHLSRGRDGRYMVETALNDGDTPGQGLPSAGDGIRRAKAELIRRTEPSLAFQGRDFIADPDKAFAIFQDKAGEHCLFVVETGGATTRYGEAPFGAGRCRSVLASGRFDTPAATYFLGLFQADGPVTKLALFSVRRAAGSAGGGAAKAEPVLAAAAVRAGKVRDIKAVKAFLREATADLSPK